MRPRRARGSYCSFSTTDLSQVLVLYPVSVYTSYTSPFMASPDYVYLYGTTYSAGLPSHSQISVFVHLQCVVVLLQRRYNTISEMVQHNDVTNTSSNEHSKARKHELLVTDLRELLGQVCIRKAVVSGQGRCT